jgi:peptidoglycan/LPS O-acetylase OafA/YrhL
LKAAFGFEYCGRNLRSRYINLLQIAGTIAIIAFHVNVRGAQMGWIAVELFFVLAGYNMTRAIDRYDGVIPYVGSRVRRLAPEVSVVWCITLVCVLAGWKSLGLFLFLGSAPVFMENLIEPFFDFSANVNWVFLLSLWFVAALIQLQVIVLLLRRYFVKGNVWRLLCAILLFEALCSILVAGILGGLQRNVTYLVADTIYRLPFAHLLAITLGLMLGRGLLQGIGRYFPLVLIIVLGAGFVNLLDSNGHMSISCLGFPSEMEFNYEFIWGYPLLAFAAATLCATDGAWQQSWRKSRYLLWRIA